MAMMGVTVRKVLSLTTMVVISATILSGALAVGAGAAGTAAAAGGGSPMIRAAGTSFGQPTVSENWSGYAATSTTPFTYASTQFVQPAVSCSNLPTKAVYTSNWVGLDGFNDQTVEQDGTSAHCNRYSGLPDYYAWIEMYPLPTVREFNVTPGDVIKASVAYSTGGNFTLTVSDVTAGATKSVTDTCATCERASAEWIIERPAGCNPFPTHCFLFALANFGTATMFDNSATLQGGTRTGLSSLPHVHQIFMVQPTSNGGFYSLDNVSPISAAGNAFTTTWVAYGKKTPITLGPRQ